LVSEESRGLPASTATTTPPTIDRIVHTQSPGLRNIWRRWPVTSCGKMSARKKAAE